MSVKLHITLQCKSRLASGDELSTREMVRAVAKAREREVTPHLKVLEARVELASEEKAFLQQVPTDFTLSQRATAGGGCTGPPRPRKKAHTWRRSPLN